MVVHAPGRWEATAVFLTLAVVALSRQGLTAGGVVLAAAAVLPVVLIQRIRLRADDLGVTIVNLTRRHDVPWPEISDFGVARVKSGRCVEVRLRDGTRLHAWVPPTDRLILELRSRLLGATGESQADLDARALDDALRAADAGTYDQASALVAENRVDAAALAELLVTRARRRPGAVD